LGDQESQILFSMTTALTLRRRLLGERISVLALRRATQVKE